MQNNITIRDVTAEDISAISIIEQQCFSEPWPEAMLCTQLSDQHLFLCAEIDGQLAGYVGLMYVLDEGYISNVAVSPDFRRRHVADALLHILEDKANALKLSFLTLEVRASNTAAISLYDKHRYIKAGLRRNYYTTPREDALIMTRTLRTPNED